VPRPRSSFTRMDARSAGPTIALLAFSQADSTAWFASALAAVTTVHLIVPGDEADYVQPDLDVRVRVWPYEPARIGRPLGLPRMAREVVRLLRRVDPDVIHLQQGHYFFNSMLGRLGEVPLVITAHEVVDRRGARTGPRRVPQWLYTRGLRRADRVVVHGEALRPKVVGEGVDPSRVHVVPRGSPPAQREPGDPREPTLLFFGRIWPYKGLEYLIEAEPAITRQVPDVRIVIAGRGERLDRYRRLMTHPERFEVQDRFLTRHERDELFRRASVVVLPYVDASTSAVIPIAYAHRKPVVVTSVGGLAEAVEDGRTGLVVPPRDHSALTSALVRLLCDDELRRELGEAGLRKLEGEGSAEIVGRRALEVYELAGGAA
jgi:glycosyltransferase involved in cell wall biosynthesis